jgi:hypothetical protein
MSTLWDGFCDASYRLDTNFASLERTINFQLVANESPGEKKFKVYLSPTPGNGAFAVLPVPPGFTGACRGCLEYRGTPYFVNGPTVCIVNAAGGYFQVGIIPNDNLPVCMAANGNGQIGIISAGRLFVVNVGDGTTAEVPITDTGFLGASYITFQDGYILAVKTGTNQIQYSGTDDTPVGDMTQWSAANIIILAGQQDLLSAIFSSREYIRVFGQRRSQIYYNVGANGIGGVPFASYNETFIETGIAAPFSLADFGDSLIWIGQDIRGQRACWRDAAFQPQRVSNFGLEYAMQNYPTVVDAVAFTYIWQGHMKYRVTFPSANATWEYDATASTLLGRAIWTELNFTSSLGIQSARPEWYHCFCYGKHLVGSTGADGNPGAVYQLYAAPAPLGTWDCAKSITGTQTQVPIVRDRIARAPYANNKRVIHNRIEFDIARGVGLDGGVQPGANPQVLLRWSNDSGNTWSPETNFAIGMDGQYSIRVYLNRLGYGRDRAYWYRCADPVFNAVINAYLDMQVCGS